MPITITRQAITHLSSARSLIADPKTWVKGHYRVWLDGHNCYCSLGALNRAASSTAYAEGHGEAYRTAYRALEAAMGKIGPKRAKDGITGFNDAPSTKHGEVIKAFDLAIKTLKET